MKAFVTVTAACFVFACALTRAGEIPATQSGVFFCQSIGDATAPLYVSNLFEGNFSRNDPGRAFQRELSTTYGVTKEVSCSMAYKNPGIAQKLDADHQRWYQQIRASGGQVIETHWVFDPTSVRVAYLCFGGAQHMKAGVRTTSYLSTDPIEMPLSDQEKLGIAWDAYLTGLHPGWFFAAKGCQALPDDATKRREVIDSYAVQWKSQNAEMVRVNWTYSPVQASAADTAPSVFCQALRSDNKFWYVTPVFAAATAADGTAAMNAWRTYLGGIKDPDGLVVADSYLAGCDGPGPAKAMTHQRAARNEQINDGGGRVFDVKWTYGGATSAASTAAASSQPSASVPTAATSAAAQTYQCYMTSFGGNYVTPAFTSAKGTQSISADWQAHIKQAHPVQGVVHSACSPTTPQAAAAQLKQVGFTREDWSD